ncbi:hypothetical protein [Nocardioides cynanchi]|uniref:hypothetical protein n=1 Tax=Nocardioides cynanchi TaxID=2558918 RepID=UPI00124547A3|nr:hypothetical protein [Nocardioides cynanchi]
MPALVALGLTVSLGVAVAGTSALGAPALDRSIAKGSPGHWTKISSSTVDTIYEASMVRTADGVLHVVYPRKTAAAGNPVTLAHTSLTSNGATIRQNDVLPTGWATMDNAPVVVNGASGPHVIFGGQLDTASGFFDSGRMFMADATSDSGATWTLPAQNVGVSNAAYGSYGTSAVELADGTPVAAFPLNETITWHVGTGPGADGSFSVPGASLYDTTMVRDGSNVWIGWFAYGSTAATTGIFARQILPSVGPVLKAPGSSQGTNTLKLGRVALAARAGGGVYEAYCVGYATCSKVRVWKVGTSKTADVPHSHLAETVALSAGPSGRLWVAWSDNLPKVRAVRTGVNGLAMGAVQNVGIPSGHPSVYSLVLEGSRGRGDIVVNVGDGFWHTQVFAGLTLHASPSKWRHGSRQRVVFTVTDAHAAVKNANVKVGSSRCTTGNRGTCAITFPRTLGAGKHNATASRKGYAKAIVTLKVR